MMIWRNIDRSRGPRAADLPGPRTTGADAPASGLDGNRWSEGAPVGGGCRVAGRIVVTGASSQVGDFLLPRLQALGYRVHAVSRTEREGDAVAWYRADLAAAGALAEAAEGCEALVHLAPLWTLPPHLPALAAAGVLRVVAFGSTSRYGKAGSSSPDERSLVRRLASAEASLAASCEAHAITWTLLRPTLIYGSGRDRNVTSIARVAGRLGFFAVAGAGRGLRQPVHADDLARAVVAVLGSPATANRSYNLGGGETLTYREMVERVLEAVGCEHRVLSLPTGALRLALGLLRLVPGFRHVRPEMADRMNHDLVYDSTEAVRDFGYRARPFAPGEGLGDPAGRPLRRRPGRPGGPP
jgi:nucleoside-diphosphate-sugar epimerase